MPLLPLGNDNAAGGFALRRYIRSAALSKAMRAHCWPARASNLLFSPSSVPVDAVGTDLGSPQVAPLSHSHFLEAEAVRGGPTSISSVESFRLVGKRADLRCTIRRPRCEHRRLGPAALVSWPMIHCG